MSKDDFLPEHGLPQSYLMVYQAILQIITFTLVMDEGKPTPLQWYMKVKWEPLVQEQKLGDYLN